MLVKCVICGKRLPKRDAFCVDCEYTGRDGEIKLDRKYYCSEDEYRADELRKKKAADEKNRVYELLCEIFGVTNILHTALYKEWKEWNIIATNEQIAIFLSAKKKYLSNIMSTKLRGQTEYTRIRYISAIIKNSLNDFQRGIEHPWEEQEEETKAIDYIFIEDIKNRKKEENNKKKTLAEIEALFS